MVADAGENAAPAVDSSHGAAPPDPDALLRTKTHLVVAAAASPADEHSALVAARRPSMSPDRMSARRPSNAVPSPDRMSVRRPSNAVPPAALGDSSFKRRPSNASVMSASNDSSFKRRPSNACIATDVTSGGGSFNSRLSRGPTGEGGERMVRSERWSDGDMDEFEAAVELQKVKRRSLDGTSSKTQAESKVVRHLAERRVSDFNEASAASAGATARARR